MFRTIDEAVNWITNRRNLSKGFESYCELMETLGNPQDKIPSIHIAGTNGKGSTCTFIKDCLVEAGYKVGTFTSPHLIQHQDRIRINGEWIEEEVFVHLCNVYKEVIETNELNMFEIDFLIACAYFIQEQVDFMIIEVGLGGRLDCTNCLHHPLMSCITSIGLDHMELLGDTKEKIAIEKAGIIKENGICVVGRVDSSVFDEIEKVAMKQHAKLLKILNYIKTGDDTFVVMDNEYTITSKASYQMHNATLALTVLQELKKNRYIEISDIQLQSGIKKSVWEGRFEVISQKPLIILDGAHNEEGIEALLDAVQVYPKPWNFVFAALKDKPAKQMVQKIVDVADHVIVTEFEFYRVLSSEMLKINDDVECIPNMDEAIRKGVSLSEKNGTLILCGSLYFISEVRAKLKSGV
ncbi:bifunctional folylpolyglutamate synthase/dihydrofolate synthase [Anaerorhabdus sp.]|uniref:bifunctional folylpolyglutamate synthase/dihydrofolate synthase n=1 Tax=Anaerorhabdus sp. TaxID=1872524 RepID=UPI002FC7800A